jgi:PAS domain S-box-containing protein
LKARRAKRSTSKRAAGSAEARKRLRETERRLRQVEERYEIAMGAINESVYDWDLVRDRFSYSESMNRVIGLPPSLLKTIGDWQKRIHPEDFPQFRAATIAHMKAETKRLQCDYRYLALDGTWRWARTHGLATRDKNGRAVRLVGSTGDITELKRTEEALKQIQDRYALAIRAINEGVYEWDIVNGTAYFSPRVYEAIGLTPDHFKTPQDWRNRIHPDDLPNYDAALVAHFKGERDRFECDYRYRARDGSWRWARQHGVAVRDAGDRAVRMTGSTGDITDLKCAEEALRTSEERYALATSAAVEGIYEWDLETGTLYLTERAKAFFAFPAEQLTPVAWNVRVHAEDYPRYRNAIVEHFKGRTPQLEIEYRIADAQGSYKWVLDRGKAVRGANGRAIKVVGALSDITQRKRAEAQLENLLQETKQALEQQTATAEILKVTSGSPGEVQPVLQAILTNASRLCEASFAAVFLYDGGTLTNVAQLHASPEFAAFLRGLKARPGRETTTRRCALELRTIHTPDLINDPEFSPPEQQRRENVRSALSVPMMRDGRLIGVITLWRNEVRPFTDRQIALVETFANQAVIAIENVRLFNETREALEQQTATAEILRVMASSPDNVQPVFDAIVRSAVRLCEGLHCSLFRLEGGLQHFVAHHGVEDAVLAHLRARYPRPPTPLTLGGRALLERATVHVEDVRVDPRFPESQVITDLAGYRAVLAVPMLKEGEAVGLIFVVRREARSFSEKQVKLLQTFADEAVIAIENVRLFNETRESLEQQKASGEVLSVISSSIADTAPVFDKILESCERLFAGRIVGLNLVREDGMLHIGAYHGAHREEFERIFPIPLNPESGSGLSILERRVVHYPDTEHGEGVPERTRKGCKAIGIKSAIFAPLLWEGRGMGAIFVGRDHVSSFSEKEIALLKTFADQAAIAIENVRLFNETKEALERQTATAGILRVISGSPTDTQPVFEEIVQSGLKLFSGAAISIALPDGDRVRAAAVAESDPQQATAWRSRFPFPLTREYMHGLAILERRVVDIPDVRSAPERLAPGASNFLASGYRAITIMPMMRGDTAIGALSVVRLAPGPLTDKQLAVLKTFADQATIAIENVRLFNETKEALEQQTAISEILRAISGSPGEVAPMLEAVAERAVKLCESGEAGIFLQEGDHFRFAAGCQTGSTFRPGETIRITRGSVLGRALIDREVVHVVDLAAAPMEEYPLAREYQKRFGHRSIIAVPLMREDRAIGVIGLWRFEVRPFSDKHIALVRTFADQAAIAIENVRLFREIQEKSQQLEIANRHKSEFLANMSHELRTPLNAIIGFTRIVMRRSKDELEAKQYENLEKIHSSGQHLLQLINAILDLSKVEAGRVEVNAVDVALAPVLEQCVKTVEPLVKAPAVRLLKEFDGELPRVYTDEEKLRQIVINLLSNAVKFTEQGTVRVQAKGNGASFTVAVADTGIGIPADKLEHVFEEFAQADASSTRVYGGTGLGLTIARRLARLMGGDISVHSQPGAGSTFTLTLPLRYHA